jgi:hypothetical protein
MTLLLRFCLSYPQFYKWKANKQNGFEGFSYQFRL